MRINNYGILVIDDYDEMGRTVANETELPKPQVMHALDAAFAMNMVQKQVFDLFLIDYRLKDENQTNGFTLAETLRQTYPRVPQIMISAYWTDALIRECVEKGMLFVEKPFPTGRLKHAVRFLLEYLPKWRQGHPPPAEQIKPLSLPQAGRLWKPLDHEYIVGQLYVDHFDELFRLTAKKVNGPEVAKEIVHVALSRVLNRNPEVEHIKNLFHYWKISTENCCNDWHRKKRMENRRVEWVGEYPEVPSNNAAPDEAFVESLEMQALREHIASLTRRYREVIDLRCQDMSYQEIAERTGLTVKQIKNALYNAKKKLKNYLKYF